MARTDQARQRGTGIAELVAQNAHTGSRDARREAHPIPANAEGDTEIDLRKLRYWSGVAYTPGEPGEPFRARDQGRDRM